MDNPTRVNAFLSRLDVRTKTAGFLCLTLLAFFFNDPLINLGLAAAATLITLAAGTGAGKTVQKVKPLLPIFVMIVLMSSVSYPPGHFSTRAAQVVYFSLGSSVFLTSGGMMFGLTLVFRIWLMVLATAVLVSSTPLDGFLQLLQKMRMPYQLAFALTTAIRFVPTMQRKSEAIFEAQRARGARIGGETMLQRVLAYLPVMTPLMVIAVRMSDNLAVGMLNRGYGANVRATALTEIRMKVVDYWLCGLFGVLLAAGAYLSWLGFGGL